MDMVYFDSNVFIYYLEGEPTIADRVRRLFSVLSAHPRIIITSELTLAEVLAPTTRSGAMPLHIKRRLYLNLIAWNPIIALKPVTRGVLYETAELRQITQHKLPDAIHVVTAIQSGCRFFLSGDRDAKKLPAGIKHLKPNESDIKELIGHLNA